MQKITSSAELKEAIRVLEAERTVKLEALKDQFQITAKRLIPVNLLRDTLNNGFSPGVKNTITGTVLGLLVSFLSSRIFNGKSAGSFRKIVGLLVETGLTGFIAQNSEAIRSLFEALFKKMFPREKVVEE